MDNPICANCHYSFTTAPYSPCKCQLCLDPSSEKVKSFIGKQRIAGYRVAMLELTPDSAVLSDSEILEKIRAHNHFLRVEIERIVS